MGAVQPVADESGGVSTKKRPKPAHRRSSRPDAEGAERAGLGEVASGASLNLVGAAFSGIATLGMTIVVTRHFGRPEAGAFFAASSLMLIAEAIANLGAYNGAIYFIARLRAWHEEDGIPAVLRATVIPVTVVSLSVAAVLVAFAEPLAHALLGDRTTPGVDPATVARSLRILAAAVPFAALADTFLGATRGYRDMRPTVFVDRFGRVGGQLVGAIIAAALSSSALLAPLWALPFVPAAMIGAWWLRRIHRRSLHYATATDEQPTLAQEEYGDEELSPTRDLAGKRPPTEDPAHGFWRFTAPRSVAAVAQILIQRLDIVLVAILRGPIDAAIYTAATRFLVVGQLANVAISNAAQPQFTTLFARRDRVGANTAYQATTAWIILLAWPLYLLAIIYGPQVLTIFGHSYRAGASVMTILGLAMLVATACGQVDTVLITTGRSGWSLMNGLLALSVNVGVDLALIPTYGIKGAAIGWAAAIVVSNLVPLAQVGLVFHVHPFGRGTGAACVLTTTCFCVIPLVFRALGGPHVGIALAAVACGSVLMLAGAWRFRHFFQLAAFPGLGRIFRERQPVT